MKMAGWSRSCFISLFALLLDTLTVPDKALYKLFQIYLKVAVQLLLFTKFLIFQAPLIVSQNLVKKTDKLILSFIIKMNFGLKIFNFEWLNKIYFFFFFFFAPSHLKPSLSRPSVAAWVV